MGESVGGIKSAWVDVGDAGVFIEMPANFSIDFFKNSGFPIIFGAACPNIPIVSKIEQFQISNPFLKFLQMALLA